MLSKVTGMMLLLVTVSAFGLTEARLLGQSSSGQTASFNLGRFDGIAEGDYAVIVKQLRSVGSADLRMIPVAKARNIKLNTDSSLWILYHIYDHELLVKGDKFIVLSESTMLNGRRDPRLSRVQVVAPKGKSAVVAKSAVGNDKDRLSKLKNSYQEIARTHEREDRSDADIELIDLEEWEKVKGARYRSALYRSPNKEEFRRQYRLDSFQQLVAGYLKRVNDPDFNYETFYEDQMREDNSNEFRKKSSFNTEYENYLKDQAESKVANAKLHRAILKRGESWSEEYSDEELRNVLNNVSIVEEKERRVFVMAKPNRYSLALDYGHHLTDAQTEDDPTYRRERRFSLSLDFEVTPFLKHEDLERFTFNFSARNNNTAFNADGVNANLNEYSLALGANWYPLYPPHAAEAFIPFLGTYFRSGYVQAEVPNSEKANYNLLSLPGFKAGIRYKFRNQLGLRMVASMETLRLEQFESSGQGDILPKSSSMVEGSLGFGVIYNF